MIKKTLFSLLICFTTYAQHEIDSIFLGPIFTNGENQPAHLFSIQPYFFLIVNDGYYTASRHRTTIKSVWTIGCDTWFYYGLNEWLDISGDINYQYIKRGHSSSSGIADNAMRLGIQFIKDKKDSSIPGIRLIFKETFPVGKYQKLNPEMGAFAATGTGAYLFATVLALTKQVFWITDHPIYFRLNFYYEIPTRVHVKEFNYYGGGYGCDAKVTPGNYFLIKSSMEIAITKKWIYEIELLYELNSSTHYSGNPGLLADSTPSTCASPSWDNLNLTTALEYNFSKNFGILFGVWLSIIGRNSLAFESGIVSLVYTF